MKPSVHFSFPLTTSLLHESQLQTGGILFLSHYTGTPPILVALPFPLKAVAAKRFAEVFTSLAAPPAIAFFPQPLLIAVGIGLRTCVVVDIGEDAALLHDTRVATAPNSLSMSFSGEPKAREQQGLCQSLMEGCLATLP